MSEPPSQPTHALAKVQQAGASSSYTGPSTGSTVASNRATQGSNGSSSFAEQTGGDDSYTPSAPESDDPVDGLASWFSGMAGSSGNAYQPTPTQSPLSEDEKNQLKHALSTMEKKAGQEYRPNANHSMEPPPLRPFNGGMSVSYLQSRLENPPGGNFNFRL